MKKSRKALTFTAAVMTAAMLSACHETVYGPPPETVYGPPEDPEQSVVIETPEYDPESEIPEDVYGPPPDDYGYDEPVETVYGPPEGFGLEEPAEPEIEETEEGAESESTPEDPEKKN